MSETKRTPGPWHVNDGDNRFLFVDSQTEGSVCKVAANRHSEANARLLAAAPTLLNALQGLIDICEQGWIPPEDLDSSSPEEIWNSACEQFRICGALGLARAAIKTAGLIE